MLDERTMTNRRLRADGGGENLPSLHKLQTKLRRKRRIPRGTDALVSILLAAIIAAACPRLSLAFVPGVSRPVSFAVRTLPQSAHKSQQPTPTESEDDESGKSRPNASQRKRNWNKNRNPSQNRSRNWTERSKDDRQEEFQLSIPKSIPSVSDIYYNRKSLPTTSSTGQIERQKPQQQSQQQLQKQQKQQPQQKQQKQQQPQQQQQRRNTKNESGDEKRPKRRPQKKPRREHRESASPPGPPFQAVYHVSVRTQSKIREKSHNAAETLRELLRAPLDRINAANVVGSLTYSAKVRHGQYDREKVKPLLSKTMDMLEQILDLQEEQERNQTQVVSVNATMPIISIGQLANAAWALAKHANRNSDSWLLDHPVVDRLADAFASRLDGAKIQELCMAAWAYGVLRHRRRPPGWSGEPQIHSMSQIFTYKPFRRSKSAASTLDLDVETEPEDSTASGRMLIAVAESLLQEEKKERVVGGKEDSTKNDNDKDWFDDEEDDLFTESKPRLRVQGCSWAELANVAWAYASHGTSKDESVQSMLQEVSSEASRRLTSKDSGNKFLTRDIAQLVWAIGTLQTDNFRLADGLVKLIDGLSEYIFPAARRTTTVYHEPRFQTRRRTSMHRGRPFRRWTCPDLVQIAESLARARIDSQDLLVSIYEEARHRLMEGLHVAPDGEDSIVSKHMGTQSLRRSFLPWEISVLLWAQARLYLRTDLDETFGEFTTAAVECLGPNPPLGPQEQANIAWALTVLEENSEDSLPLMRTIFRTAARKAKEDRTLQVEHAHQLWQSYVLLDEDDAASMQVPTWFTDCLKEEWIKEKSREKISSARHQSLSATLKLMGIDHFNEHDEDIDVAIVLRPSASWTHETDEEYRSSFDRDATPTRTERVAVAVEFDGPNHFTREVPPPDGGKPPRPRALGHSVLKYRLLNKQGWAVVRVPYYEWDRIPFWASMERQRYLQRKLKTHATIQFSEADQSLYKTLPSSSRESRFD